jgi:uncharacterized membrane protein
MRKVDASAALFAGASILYPLLAALGVHHVGPTWVLIGLFVLLALRALPALRGKVPGGLTWGLVGVAGIVAAVALYDRALSVRLYPALMSAAMLLTFAQTIWSPPSMIERFARLIEPDLDEVGVRYARNVTLIWCAFFVANCAMGIWTALYADWSFWTLYNGLIAYVGIGVLFFGEVLVRPLFRKDAG